jgi:hypothetical protein
MSCLNYRDFFNSKHGFGALIFEIASPTSPIAKFTKIDVRLTRGGKLQLAILRIALNIQKPWVQTRASNAERILD